MTGVEKGNHQSYVWVGFSFAHYIKVLQFLISEISVRLHLWLLSDHLGNILPLYLAVVDELGGGRSELRAARQKMAAGAMLAVVNAQHKIIFKGALKIICVAPLTQSANCCMVNFQRRPFTAIQLVFDEHLVFWWTPSCTSDVVWEFKHPIMFWAICMWHIFSYCPGAHSFKSTDWERCRTDLMRKSFFAFPCLSMNSMLECSYACHAMCSGFFFFFFFFCTLCPCFFSL